MAQLSEKVDLLFAAISIAQGEMPSAFKDSINPYYKSRYAGLTALFEAVRPVLSKNGLAVVFLPGRDENGTFMKCLLTHSSGQWMSGQLPIIISENGKIQDVGSLISYLKRYLLGCLTTITAIDEDDDGEGARLHSTSYAGQPATSHKDSFISGDQVDNLERLLDALQSLPDNAKINCFEKFKTEFRINDISELQRRDYYRAIDTIQRNIDTLKNKR